MPEPSQGHFEKSENTSHTPPIDNKYVSLHDLIEQEEAQNILLHGLCVMCIHLLNLSFFLIRQKKPIPKPYFAYLTRVITKLILHLSH